MDRFVIKQATKFNMSLCRETESEIWIKFD